MTTTRRSGSIAAIALALVLATPPAAGAEDWLFTKVDYPPKVLAHLRTAQADGQSTSATMETSNAGPVRGYRKFLDGLAARKPARIDQIKAVNNYVNAHVRQKPDLELDGDIWAPPLQTLLTGGDCEDVALVKYWGLKRLGVDPKDMFLAMGMTLLTEPPEGHALLAVRMPDGSYQVMYSLVSKVEGMTQNSGLKYFEPAYALNTEGFWRIDEQGRPKGDYWQNAFVRAVQRKER